MKTILFLLLLTHFPAKVVRTWETSPAENHRSIACVAQPEVASNLDLSRVEEIILEAHKNGVPAVSVLVYEQGKIHKRSVGFGQLENQQAAGDDDVFRLASITKLFTSVVVEQLREEGKLEFDTKVVEILSPEVTRGIPHINDVTVGHLLNHRSGIYNFTDGDDFTEFLCRDKNHFRQWRPQDYLQFIVNDRNRPNFRPGQEYAYCNTGFILLGYIVEKIEGKPFDQVLREKIFEPCGMESSYVEGANHLAIQALDSYGPMDRTIVPLKDKIDFRRVANSDMFNFSNGKPFNAWAYAAGAINSNTDDVLSFALKIKDGKTPMPTEWKKMLRERDFFDGNGGARGISSSLFISQKHDWVIVTLCNANVTGHEAFRISLKIAKLLE